MKEIKRCFFCKKEIKEEEDHVKFEKDSKIYLSCSTHPGIKLLEIRTGR